jgi:predicted PurR-regulated permease PerM
MTFGLVGIFVGPIVLAVSYTLVAAWVDGAPQAEPKSLSARTPAGS